MQWQHITAARHEAIATNMWVTFAVAAMQILLRSQSIVDCYMLILAADYVIALSQIGIHRSSFQSVLLGKYAR